MSAKVDEFTVIGKPVKRLEGGRRLHEGDLLQVGDTELRFGR